MTGPRTSGVAPGAAPHDSNRHAGNTLPIWLKPDLFLTEQFNEDECIAELRKYVPMDTLRTELEEYLLVLKNKLVAVINEDYGEYANLSTRMVNLEGAVLRMQKPLLELQARLVAVQTSLQHELATLREGLQKRQEAGAARSTLELLLEISHVASKVELLLEEAEGQGVGAAGASRGDLDARCRMLERVAGEASRLTFLANKGQGLAHIDSLEARIAAIRGRLDTHLQAALQAALQERAWGAAAHCLHAYVELGEGATAEEVVHATCVRPVVLRLAADAQQAGRLPAAPDASPSAVLEELLGALMQGVRQECAPLLEAARGSQGGRSLFNFPVQPLLQEVLQALTTQLPDVFSPGVPTAFHANWQVADSWLQQLEALCPSRQAVDTLRASPSAAAFQKAWSLPAYFSLLAQATAGHLEEAIQAGREPLAPAPSDPQPGHAPPSSLQLGPTIAAWECCQRVLAPTAWLHPLADRLLRLLLSVWQRYAAWLAAIEATRRSPPAADATTGEAPEGQVAWAVGLPAAEVVALVREVEAARAAIGGPLRAQVEGVLAELGTEAQQAAAGALQEVVSGLLLQERALMLQVVGEVVEQCAAVLKQVKGISATYRIAARGMPTRPSHYVSGVLVPLRTWLKSREVGAVSEEGRKWAAQQVALLVSEQYQRQAAELVTAVRKTETSLKRLKKTRAQEEQASGEAAVSDSDKVLMQLALDAREFGSQLEGLGLDPASLPSHQELLQFVSLPAASIQQ